MTSPRYRNALPQLSGRTMLTDSGLETTLIYHDGFDLPCFASFHSRERTHGRAALRRYFDTPRRTRGRSRGVGFIARYADLAREPRLGRAARLRRRRRSPKRTAQLWRSCSRAARRWSTGRHRRRQRQHRAARRRLSPGPGDEAAEAEAYHTRPGRRRFADAGVDMITAMTHDPRRRGPRHRPRAKAAGVPVSMGSFTVETDGRLPTGQPLGEAIEESTPRPTARGLLHDQLRPPDAFRATSWRRRRRGAIGSAASAPTPRA